MTPEPIDVAGFRLLVSDIEGVRAIETRYPPIIDVTKLSTVIAAFYDLWDDDAPTINLTDVEQLERLSNQARAVLKSVVTRTIGQDTFVASAWICGANLDVKGEIVAILREAGRPGDSVFASRDEALEYLRACIVEWRANSASSLGAESERIADGDL